jgi:proto-oncogene tyrosine-protein kinase ROS
MRIVDSCTLKDFAVKPQSKRIIYFNDTTQVFTSTFLDGSASHLVLPRVPFADVKSFACENNDFLVTDGKAIFQQDVLSFNEFIVGCDLSHIEEYGFGNLVIFSSSIQSHPLPGHPQEISVLFGSHQALVQWKPPALAIGASECTVLRVAADPLGGEETGIAWHWDSILRATCNNPPKAATKLKTSVYRLFCIY